MSSKTVNLRYGTVMLVITVFAVLFHEIDSWLVTNISQILMLLVCIIWFNTLRYRVVIPDLRRLLCAMSVMLAVLNILTVGRYTIFKEMPLVNRYINYLYQLPVLLCALLSFYSAVCIGAADTRAVIKKYIWMPVFCAVIIAGYLTNDLHHLAYQKVSPDGGVSGYFLVCYVSWVFQAASLGTGFITILRRCRISNMKRLVWLPILFLTTGAAGLIIFVIKGILMIGPLKITFQTIFVFLMIGFWESCIIIGLVPSNSRYIMLMDSLPINMQITDKNGRLRYDSAEMPITDEQRKAALSAPVTLEGYTVLSARSIPGGHAFWTEDRSKIEKLNEDLRERIDDLREKNALLQQENEIKEDKTRYEVQNRTYSRLASDLQPTSEKVRAVLAEGDLAHACVLGAYLKRRANLYLLAEQSGDTDISELYHSVKESLDALRLLDITCAVYTDDEGRVTSQALLDAYDFFEKMIEREMFSAKAVMVVLGAENGRAHITVNISGDDADGDDGCFTGVFGGGEPNDV